MNKEKRKRILSAIALCTVSATLLAATGCGKPGGKKKSKIAVITKNSNVVSFWDEVKNGAEDAGDELGYEIVYTIATGDNDFATQVDAINKAVDEGVEAIIIAPNSQTELNEALAKAQAKDKLENFIVKIGYPDKWKDFTNLEISDTLSLTENLDNVSEFFLLDDLRKKVNKPVDKSEWFMTPQTINAYYNPTSNEICFPAGILQPPFFDPEADDALNYGAIGGVIGHEMSHGFDDQGSQFDKTGNQRNWWTEQDKKNFDQRTQVLVDHFSNIEVVNGKKVNGKLTLGENIGDNGGLNIALRALRNTGNNTVIDGFTADQRFFLAWARVWAGTSRPEYQEMLITVDPHSPELARVNGALPMVDDWYTAFNIKKGKLFVPRKKRAHIW